MKTITLSSPKLLCGFLLIFAVCLTPNVSRADDAKIIHQFVNPTTIVVARFDLKRIALPDELQKAITKNEKNQPLLEWIGSMQKNLESIATSIADGNVYLMVDLPFSAGQSPIRLLAKKSPTLDLAKLNEQLAQFRYSPAVVTGDYVCTSPFQSMSETNKIAIGDETIFPLRTELPAALHAVAEHPIQILILPPGYVWATFRDLLPQLPARFGGLPSSTLTDGMQWAAIGIDPATSKMQATIQSNSNAAAQSLADNWPKLLSLTSSQLPDGGTKEAIKTLIDQIKPSVTNDCIVISFNGLQQLNHGGDLIAAVVNQIVDPLSTRHKMNHFKELALAIHHYYDTFKVFPPNKEARNEAGYSNFSWRVHILPYIGESALHAQFRLKEPWNSEHNSKLLEKMPSIFAGYPATILRSTSIPVGHTTFLAPSGNNTIFGGNKPVKFSDIQDGSSNTIMLVEVKPELAVPWTAPAEYSFQPTNPASGLATGADGQFIAALGDGFVRTVPANLPNETIIHLFQMSDGKAINW